MEFDAIKSILIAVGLGFMIGMQRAIYHLKQDEKSFAGSRTFSLIAMVGYMAGLLNDYLRGIALVMGFLAGSLILAAYYFKGTKRDGLGTTTHFSAMATYLLGMMVSLGLADYAIFLGVLLIVLLEMKPRLQKFEARITSTDINAAVLLLAMTFLVLPVLPDRMIGPYQLFNPYKTWLMAVVISAISFVGYAAIKILGHKRGIFLTGALGGLVSSTAVSVSMSRLALSQRGFAVHFAAAIAIACTFMFLRVLVLVFVVNPELAGMLTIPFSAATLAGLGYTWHLYKTSQTAKVSLDDSFAKNPLQLSEAIKFGLLFGLVYGAVAFVKARYGNVGVYIVSLLSGITDVDAVTLTLAQLAGEGDLRPSTAVNGIVIASVVNSLVKLGIVCWVAGWRLCRHLVGYFLATLAAMSAAGLWFFSDQLF